ncbi:MAG: hypothetical protein IPN36_11600 [Bacteroidetes bacterium]|nr:hypothetical protein [Bacteroidota bacterium]
MLCPDGVKIDNFGLNTVSCILVLNDLFLSNGNENLLSVISILTIRNDGATTLSDDDL